MDRRGTLELLIGFGPTTSPLFGRAASYATAHATTSAEISPGVWRAAFTLGTDPEPYARAWRLLRLVGSWRGTEVEVSGSPEPLAPVQAMTACAREWLRKVGACRAPFPSGPWPKCERCPGSAIVGGLCEGAHKSGDVIFVVVRGQGHPEPVAAEAAHDPLAAKPCHDAGGQLTSTPQRDDVRCGSGVPALAEGPPATVLGRIEQ
ncbi:MAG TPA: hypothetical protein VF984_02810 [Actinomycetota bacterium]